MKRKSNVSLLSAIIFFVLGTIIFVNPDILVKVISYGLGGILILVGTYKTVNYYVQDKRLGIVNRNELAFGITAVILGLLFIFLAGAIELLLRFIVGGWLVLAGLKKITATFFTTDRSAKFYALLIVGFLLIAGGLYIILISNLALSIIGLIMMLYGLIDVISFFVNKNTTEEEILDENVIGTKRIDIEDIKQNAEEVIFEEKIDEEKSSKKKTNKRNNTKKTK